MKKKRDTGVVARARALNVFVKLVRAAETVSVRVHAHLTEAELTISQFGVIEALYHLGPLSQAEIAKKILKSGGNITMVIDNLEKRGLVRRERRAEDRRYYAVQLTPAGRKIIGRIFPNHAIEIVSAMSALTGKEQETLGKLCKKLGLAEQG